MTSRTQKAKWNITSSMIPQILTVSLNTVFVVALTDLGCNIIIVKLAGSFVYLMKPLLLAVYVRRHYKILPPGECAV